MTLVWNPLGLLGLVAGTIEIALAIAVYRAGPDRWANRYLSATLFSFGLFSLTWLGLRAFEGDPTTAYALGVAGMLANVCATTGYALFLSTLPTPLVRPLATRVGRGLILAAGAAFLLILLVMPADWISGVTPREHITGWSIEVGHMGRLWSYFVVPPILLFAVVAAVHSWRRAQTALLRRQMRTYAIGFGTQDAIVATNLTAGALGLFTPGTPATEVRDFAVLGLAVLFGSVVLAYGILKHHLFDIDLKLKWTINKSTLVGIFVGVFFVSAQVAHAFLTTEYGWAIGGLVAGLLLLAINPLQRFAGRVADKAMPNVQDTEGYKDRRRQEIYRVTLEEMLIDDNVSTKERRALLKLQQTLGLDGNTATRLEAEILDMRQEAR